LTREGGAARAAFFLEETRRTFHPAPTTGHAEGPRQDKKEETMQQTRRSPFIDRQARTRYLAVTAATFLTFTTGACLSYLSKVLATVGFDPAETGLLVAAGSIPVVVCSLLAGRLLLSLRPRSVVALGIAMLTLGYASLGWTSAAGGVGPAFASLAVMIGGVGLFMPAAFLMVRSCLVPERLMQFVGIYGAMQLMPSIFGPMWAQRVFEQHGLRDYFLITALPAVAGLCVLFIGRDGLAAPVATPAGSTAGSTASSAAGGESYGRLLAQPKVALPCLGGIVSGGVFGAVNIFVVLLLSAAQTPIHHFFVPFVLAYLVTRFFLLGWFNRLDKATVVGCGVGLMALGVSVLWAWGAGPTNALAAALLFGVGFSITYPVSVVWISELFPPESRAKPVALFNSLYTFGMYASPLAAGALLRVGGANAFYVSVVGTGLLAAAVLVLFRTRARAA
jgi:MFS family permease